MRNRTIYKYSLEQRRHRIPALHKVIHAGVDPVGELCVWVEVDASTTEIDVSFFRVGTGHVVPDGAEHIWSFNDGPFVWHIYKEYG